MFSVFAKIWRFYRPLRPAIVAIFVLLILDIVTSFTWPYFYGKVINAVIAHASITVVFHLLLIAFGFLSFQNLVSYITGKIELASFDYDYSTLTQKSTFKKLLSLSINQHRNEHSGLTQSVVSEGQNAIMDIMNISIYQIFPILFRVPIAIVALSLISWKLSFIALAGFVINAGVSFASSKWLTEKVREEREMTQELGKKRMEILRNAPLVIANAEEESVQQVINVETSARDTFAKGFWGKFMWISYVIRPVVSDVTLVGTVAMGAYMVATGQILAGAMVTVIMWSGNLLTNFGMLMRMQRQIIFSGERAKKYFSILDLESDIRQPEQPVSREKLEGAIEFKNIHFTYPRKKIIEDDKKKVAASTKAPAEPKEVLHGISFSIPAGKHAAFVGASGAGKSTAALLLVRGVDPQEGSVLVDGIDLREMDLTAYRRTVGVVDQHIVLFDDTLRRNISFGLGDGKLLSDEEIEKLAKIARLDEFREKLTDGWDTVIGENGIKLSGGQRQRVGIARALAKDPAILILDEATSSLDAKNEALIKDALVEASKGRTTITIAHRLSTIKDADVIFVFDKGAIVGQGKHEELLKTSPVYADLVSHQTVML